MSVFFNRVGRFALAAAKYSTYNRPILSLGSSRSFSSSTAQSVFTTNPKDYPTPPSNFQEVKSYEEFSSQVFPQENSHNNLFAIYYYASFSTSSKSMMPAFYKLAASNPTTQFMAVNTDECPRAAYYADISSVPSVLVCYKDDAYRKLISPGEMNKPGNIMSETQAAIDAFNSEPNKQKFRSKHAWYTHNIASDNLNIKNVGWPAN